MLLNLDIHALRLNSDPNGQSQEKYIYFSSPVFVFLFSFRPNIENKKPDARNAWQRTQRLMLLTMSPY